SAMVKGLADYGAQIAIVGRKLETAEQVVRDIEEKGGKAEAFQADVLSKRSLQDVAAEIEAWAGGWDILLNAPGTNSPTAFFELEEDEWDQILDVNLKGIMLTTQVFAEKMIEQKRQGSIINI